MSLLRQRYPRLLKRSQAKAASKVSAATVSGTLTRSGSGEPGIVERKRRSSRDIWHEHTRSPNSFILKRANATSETLIESAGG